MNSDWRSSRVELGEWPSPVLDAGPLRSGLWVKDDGLCAPAFGGNKVRKLEFLLHDAPRVIATMGALGSHHVLATAVHGSRCAHDVHAVTMPRPWSRHSEQVLRATARLATLHHAPDHDSAEAQLSVLEREGMATFPAGGSNATGACGFVLAGEELAEQVRAGLIPEPQRVFCALGTAGTAVGLAMGLRACGLESRVIGVRVVPADWLTVDRIESLAEDVAALTGLDPDVPVIDDGFLGDGYGRDTPEGIDACARMESTMGLSIETTYTGKALAAALACSGTCDLFWQTASRRDLAALPPCEADGLDGISWAGRSRRRA